MNQPDTKGKSVPTAGQPAGVASVERACPECGEMVRKGLVRCWNCGAFMDEKLQQRYQEMQSNPSPPVFSQVPAEEMHSLEDASDDGFQLAIPASTSREDLRSLDVAVPGAEPKTAAEKRAADDDAGGPAHSVATAGDVLLMAAMQEQAEIKEKRRRRPLMTGGAKTTTGFIIFCPYGCRIEVKEQHRGMQGKCPKCRAPFIVPVDPPDYTASKKAAAEQKPDGAAAAGPGGYQVWIDDLHVHTVNPEKLKLKADSLLKDFVEQDIAFGPEGMLVVSLTKKGKFVGGVKNKADARAAMLQHLKDGKPLAELPAGDQKAYKAEQLVEMRVVEPAASRALSLFHGIPIFGTGRIAVLLPIGDDGATQYVSMGVTQFRKFAQALADVYGLHGFGADAGIPATEVYEEAGKCHYLGTPVRSLKNLEFYKADPTVEVVLSGWKCAACSLIISEDARQKEKLGGKEGKGLAKVKCPKCTQKFGENPMYALKQEASQTSMGAADDVAEPAAT